MSFGTRRPALVLALAGALAIGSGCGGPKGPEAYAGTPLRTLKSDRGVDIEVFAEGSGPAAAKGDWVRVHYRVLLSNGDEVDSSHERKPLVFQLDSDVNMINGFHESIRGMKAGELRRAQVPQHLGYGNRTMGPIPAKSALVFELELVEPPRPPSR